MCASDYDKTGWLGSKNTPVLKETLKFKKPSVINMLHIHYIFYFFRDYTDL